MARRTAPALVVLLIALIAAGCSPLPTWRYALNETHVVRSGETLSVIADRYGKNYRDLARWNRLGDGSLIYPGQVIRLVPPARGSAAAAVPRSKSPPPRPAAPAPADPPPPWGWPTDGRIIAGFGGGASAESGVLITGKAGQPVRAAASGRVVYSGGGLIGYGQLIIVKHNDTYLSAYGHNASLLVKEGQTIKKGQRIATMGEGPGQSPSLHFEIRRNGEPVDPRRYLPAQ